MKYYTIIIISILFFSRCNNVDKTEKVDLAEIRKSMTPTDSSLVTDMLKTLFLENIKNFPIIKDSAELISEIKYTFDLVIDKSEEQRLKEKITVYKKVKLYGSDKDYIFIEYDYGVGCNASYPWKYQLILTTDGKLVSKLSELKYEFLEIFKNENPFLLTLTSTAKGNGGHNIFKINGDSLLNVYSSYEDFEIQTYDCHEDSRIYEPNELKLIVKDFNHDGINDISFNGLNVLIQGKNKNGDLYDTEEVNGKTITYSVDHPFRKIPLEFIFLYDKKTGRFKAKEDYIKKYDLNS